VARHRPSSVFFFETIERTIGAHQDMIDDRIVKMAAPAFEEGDCSNCSCKPLVKSDDQF
jgi:hypothetical protein